MSEKQKVVYVKEQNEFIQWMSRHLVGLSGTYFPFDDKTKQFRTQEEIFIFPGFILELAGDWFYVTAGHNLLDVLVDYVNKGWIKLTGNYAFLDYFGPDAMSKDKVIFDYDRQEKLRIDEKNLGIDYALIPLSEYYKKHLQANKVVPFEQKHWTGTDQMEFNFYAMLGFPEEFQEPAERFQYNRNQVGLEICATLVPIKRLEEPPELFEAPKGNWFIGTVRSPFSLKGMSGGPVFGFRQRDDGRWEYRLVAVQSRWYETAQIIYACPVFPVMKVIAETLQAAQEEEGEEVDVEGAENSE